MIAARLAGVLLLVVATGANADTRPLFVLRSDGVLLRFEVEVARSAAERARGLSGRTSLAPRAGMWFDFGTPQPVSMWMKDTPLSLDIVFIDESGRVIAIHARARPRSRRRIEAPRPVRYVLELNGGTSARYALRPGDRAWLGMAASSSRCERPATEVLHECRLAMAGQAVPFVSGTPKRLIQLG